MNFLKTNNKEMNKELVYLAIPYTWNPDESFRIANEISAELMEDGEVVFSPISHSHVIADYMRDDLRTDYEFWMSIDLPILLKCSRMIIVVLGGEGEILIDKSRGCQRELEVAEENGITVEKYYYKKPVLCQN
jgi:hypothetical protein